MTELTTMTEPTEITQLAETGTAPGAPGPAAKHAAADSPGQLLREVLLTVGALAGLLCLLAALAAVFFGVTPVIFRSGSMAPAIDTGALALTRSVPLAEIRTGDVVSVINAGGQRVTHRVANVISPRPGSAGQLVLKGDANALPDPQPYRVDKADRVFFAANGLGYPVAFLQTPWAIFAGGLFAGILVFIAFRPRTGQPGTGGSGTGRSGTGQPRTERPENPRPVYVHPANRSPVYKSPARGGLTGAHRASRHRVAVQAAGKLTGRRKATAVLAILLVPISVFAFTGSGHSTLAAFTDSSAGTGGTLRAARLTDITGKIGCTDDFPTSTMTWNPAGFLPPEGSYALKITRLKSNGSIDKEMGYVGTAAGFTSYKFAPDGALLGLLSGATTFRVSIFAVVVAGGGTVSADGANILWSSAAATVGNRTFLNYPGILIGLAAHTQCDPS